MQGKLGGEQNDVFSCGIIWIKLNMHISDFDNFYNRLVKAQINDISTVGLQGAHWGYLWSTEDMFKSVIIQTFECLIKSSFQSANNFPVYTERQSNSHPEMFYFRN